MGETAETPGPRRGMKILLFVSLAFNLLVVCAVAGLVLTGGPKRSPSVSGVDRAVFPLVRALPDTARDGLRDRYLSERPSLSDRRRQRAAQTEMLLDLLRAQPFDGDAFTAFLDGQFAQALARGAAGRAALVAQISALDDAERQAYADRLEDMLSRDKRRSGKR